MKVQNNNFTLFTLYFKSHGKDRCCAVQIYIYIYIEVKLRENPIRFQIRIQLESNFMPRVTSNLNF